MKTVVFVAALAAATAAADTATVAGRVWRIPDGAPLDGSVLTLRVDGVSRRSAVATTEVDLSPFVEAGGVEWRVRACGSGVAQPAKPHLGLKAMLSFKDETGAMRYPGPPGKAEDFGWYLMRHRTALTNGVAAAATFTVGLQEAAGEARFDLASLEFLPMGVSWPPDDPSLQCEYSASFLAAAGGSSLSPQATPSLPSQTAPSLPPQAASSLPSQTAPSLPPQAASSLHHAARLRGMMLPSRGLHDEDFAKLRDWGVTLVRYQMNRNWSARDSERDLADYDDWMKVKLDHLEERVLPFAAKYGIKVVVDLHMPPGGKSYDHEMNMFYEPAYADHFVETWRGIAQRFKGSPALLAYDLVNEPHQTYNAVGGNDFLSLQLRAAKAIREIDPDIPIVVEPIHVASPEGFKTLRAVPMKDVVYEVHVYQPFAYTHQGVNPAKPWEKTRWPDPKKGWDKEFLRQKLAPVREFQLRHGARIYVGEFSAIAWADGAGDYLRDCIALFEEYGWDWTYHAFDESPCWNVEQEADKPFEFRPAADTPRKRALLDAFARGAVPVPAPAD